MCRMWRRMEWSTQVEEKKSGTMTEEEKNQVQENLDSKKTIKQKEKKKAGGKYMKTEEKRRNVGETEIR